MRALCIDGIASYMQPDLTNYPGAEVAPASRRSLDIVRTKFCLIQAQLWAQGDRLQIVISIIVNKIGKTCISATMPASLRTHEVECPRVLRAQRA